MWHPSAHTSTGFTLTKDYFPFRRERQIKETGMRKALGFPNRENSKKGKDATKGN